MFACNPSKLILRVFFCALLPEGQILVKLPSVGLNPVALGPVKSWNVSMMEINFCNNIPLVSPL